MIDLATENKRKCARKVRDRERKKESKTQAAEKDIAIEKERRRQINKRMRESYDIRKKGNKREKQKDRQK